MAYQVSKTKAFEWHTDQLEDKNFRIHGKTLFFIIVLFSVVFLITLLFLYIRWICRSRTRSVATSSAHIAPPVNRGLDPATIDSFPTTTHRPSMSGAECCICLGVFEDGEKVKVLPSCNHYYHPECVDRWLLTQSSCPICRASLRVDDSPV